jgi:hypothetical protein
MKRARTPFASGSGTESVSLDLHVWIIWLAFASVAVSPTYADLDLWGHTRFGLDWLDTHSLSLVDPYSFTQDRPWINHEWLSEVAMALAFRAGGGPGLIALKAIVVGLTLAVLAWRLRGASGLVAGAILMLALLTAATMVLTVRPHLWSLLGTVVLLALLDLPGKPGVSRIVVTALLFACWANLHGGWIAGMAALVVWSAVRSVRMPQETRAWVALVAAGLAATLVNPYGIGLWRFLAATVRASRPDITEWQPLAGAPLLLWLPVVVAAGFLLWLSRDPRWRPAPEAWAVIGLLIVASLRVLRVAALLGPAALVLLGPLIARRAGERGRLTVPTRGAAAILAIPVVVVLLGAAREVPRQSECVRVAGDPPDRLAGANLAGLSGRLWTTFNWGEYAIWHAGPKLRVSIDGRRETLYSDAVLAWNRAAENGDTAALARMMALAPEYAWLPATRHAARAALTSHGYRIDVETPASFIAVRPDQPPLEKSGHISPPCFP